MCAILGTARDTQWGYSLYDFSVYGSGTMQGTTPLNRAGWTVSASSTEGGGSAANVLDGNDGTRWSSGDRPKPRAVVPGGPGIDTGL